MTKQEMIDELMAIEMRAELEIAKTEDDRKVIVLQYLLDSVRERIENWVEHGRSFVSENDEKFNLRPESERHVEFVSIAMTYFR